MIGNVLCPPILILLGFVLSEFLGLIGIYWLAMTIGWVIVFVQDVLGSSDRGLIFLVVPFAYFASFFLPLFGFLCFKKRTAKNRCKVVQALFIVLHIVFHLYLIVYHNLFDKIIEFIRVWRDELSRIFRVKLGDTSLTGSFTLKLRYTSFFSFLSNIHTISAGTTRQRNSHPRYWGKNIRHYD